MTAEFNLNRNPCLNKLITLIRGEAQALGVQFRVKVFEGEYVINLQCKSSATKQVVKFVIDNDCNLADPYVKMEFRDRNPNTWDFISNPFTVRSSDMLKNSGDFEKEVRRAVKFLSSQSNFVKVPFKKIKVSRDLKDCRGDVCWYAEIANVENIVRENEDIAEKLVILKFTDGNVFEGKPSAFANTRKPIAGEMFFLNSRGEFQLLTKAKSKFLYDI